MKKNKKIRKLKEQDWADAAAWLSGEKNTGEKNARLLISEEEEIMKKWNDLKYTDNDSIDVNKAWDKLNNKIETSTPVIRLRKETFTRTFARIAATVIIVTGLGWLLFKVAVPGSVTVTTSAFEKNIEVLLNDGSKVFLNRNSRMVYPRKFTGDSRSVTLEGEAFFDIAPDASKPFIIDAGNASVRVLGTSFNVITDNGHDEVEVFVKSGTVMLSGTNDKQGITLKPDYIGKLSETGASQSLNTDTNYLSWHTDMLIFNGEPLDAVFKDLKRTYNIDIKAADPAIYDYRLTSPFERQPHDTIIKMICTTFNLHSVMEGETYILYPGQDH